MAEHSDSVAGDFRDRFGDAPAVVASAPGRVNLIGGHTDYNDGFVLPATIDRRTAVAAAPRDDRTVRVHSRAVGETRSFALDEVCPGENPRWVDYVAGVLVELADCGDVPGLELLVGGDLPLGAGLSSSAALELAVGAAATRLADLDVSREDLALLCRRAENEFVGVSCGIMDQFTVAFGEAGRALFLDCRTRERRHIPFDEETGVGTVVVDTNVAHELADSAYNERLATCREGADRFDALLDREVSALRDVSVAEFEAHADALPEPMRSRCAHVVSENARVRAAAEALADGDVERVGEAMFRSHESLRDDYEVSCAELDAVVECARDAAGVVGARMTGGGFGGSVVCLVREAAVDAFSERVAQTYRDETGVEADVYACATVDGVAVNGAATE